MSAVSSEPAHGSRERARRIRRPDTPRESEDDWGLDNEPVDSSDFEEPQLPEERPRPPLRFTRQSERKFSKSGQRKNYASSLMAILKDEGIV